MAIRLSGNDLAGIRRAGEDAFPHECCGFLLGSATETTRMVLQLLPAENTREGEARRRRYSIRPEAFLEGEAFAREQGLDIIGFYHSHPDAPARPSAYDREHAWPWYSYIIVSVQDGKVADVTSWILRNDRSAFDKELIEQQD